VIANDIRVGITTLPRIAGSSSARVRGIAPFTIREGRETVLTVPIPVVLDGTRSPLLCPTLITSETEYAVAASWAVNTRSIRGDSAPT